MPENNHSNIEKAEFHLMVRDPSWLFVYWNIPETLLKKLSEEAGCDVSQKTWIMRLMRLENASVHDIAISVEADNWYVPVEPISTYESSIGYFNDDSEYIRVIRGNKVSTPKMGVSRIVDPDWKVPEDIFYKLISPYRMKSVFSMSGLVYGKSEWENFNWPISPSVSSSDVQKKANRN